MPAPGGRDQSPATLAWRRAVPATRTPRRVHERRFTASSLHAKLSCGTDLARETLGPALRDVQHVPPNPVSSRAEGHRMGIIWE